VPKYRVMWYLVYNVLLILASPVILAILLAKKRCRRGLAQRLGFLPARLVRNGGPVLWVHAVSLGEVVAVAPLIRRLHAGHPDHQIVVSTVTETGREAVEQRLAGIAEHCYAPLDFPWVVTRVVRKLNPAAFLFVETELWPNLLRSLFHRGTPAVLVNGRLSSSSFPRYRMVKPLIAQALEAVSLCLMQSERDVERIVALGASPDRVHRTGNIKFDQPLPDQSRLLARTGLGLADGEELIVCGSTHPVEEEQLLACYHMLRREYPALVLVLAPRHIERAAAVESAAKEQGLPVVRRSLMSPTPWRGPRVIVLDTRGELAGLYRHAILAFVGGTFVPVGGHNLLEPAAWSRPVFFGPYTDHCTEMADLLLAAGGGQRVRDGAELAEAIIRLLKDRAALQQMGSSAHKVVADNQGAIEYSLKLIGELLRDRSQGEDGLAPSVVPAGQVRFPVRWLLLILTVPYGLAVRIRAVLYRLGWLPTRRLPCRVVSVGNLTVGGTGKTPVVIWLVERLLARDCKVGVLSRGYKRTGREPALLVSDGKTVLAGPAEAGDEPYLIARRCPGAVVAVGTDRYRLGRWVLERFPIDCFVLDDGFQHLGLQRDVNLLLIDASDPAGLAHLLPAGRLREPLSAAKRATEVLLTRVAGPDSVMAPIRAATGRDFQPVLVRFRAEGLVDVRTGAVEQTGSISGRSTLIFSGIARADSFRDLLAGLGVKVVEELVFPDHHAYTDADLDSIRTRAVRGHAEVILTTEKDAVKVAPLLRPDDRVLAVRLGTEIREGMTRLETVLGGER
jgi:3-deoxy-D-manno-octulosonic-acid transferase